MELSAGDGRPSGLAPKHRAPLEFGIAGLGGYASYVTDRVLDEMKSEHPAARLRAVCDPELGRYPERVAGLRQQGFVVATDFHDLLNSPVQAVWLPLPIDLHGPYTEQALGAGKA